MPLSQLLSPTPICTLTFFFIGNVLSTLAGRWTQDEHKLFLEGLEKYQKQWKLIADLVKTRTVVQIRTHAQKYFQKLNKKNGGKDGSNLLSVSLDVRKELTSTTSLTSISILIYFQL